MDRNRLTWNATDAGHSAGPGLRLTAGLVAAELARITPRDRYLLDLLPALKGTTPDWKSITLVNDAVQRPAIEKLIQESADTTESRQWQTTEKSLDAIVVAIQQVLDPSVNKSIQAIADDQQAASVASKVGVK